MTGPSEFWQLLVFCSESVRGSPTGVVFPGSSLPPDRYQPTAAALGYPDTVFLEPGPATSEWRARSFSPAQELSLCTQALIAAYRVLQEKNLATSAATLFHTPSGPITVSELVPERPDLAWLAGPYRILDRQVSQSVLAGVGGLSNTPEILIDTGRTRVFREFANVDQLSAVALEQVSVMKYCHDQQIHGICLFARPAEREIRMRVFTTSLDGREDISTGGAVLGLLPYLGLSDGDIPAGSWTVQQGFDPPHSRGTLFTTKLSQAGMTAVGGGHRFIARGTLL